MREVLEVATVRYSGLLIAGLLFIGVAVSCSSGAKTVAGDQATADASANEVAYGIENDESVSASSAAKSIEVNDTSSFNGAVSGNVSVARNWTWTDEGETPDPDTLWTSPDTANNRYWQYYGSQIVSFTNYSNVSGRTIVSGSVSASIAQASPAKFQSTTDTSTIYPSGSTVPSADNYASTLASGQVQHTVSGVNKTVTGTVTVERNGNSYTCDVNLTIDVVYRVTIWNSGSDGSLSNRQVLARDTTITGTITVNGTTFTVNKTLTKATPE